MRNTEDQLLDKIALPQCVAWLENEMRRRFFILRLSKKMVLLLARVVPNPVAVRAIPMDSMEDYPDPNVRWV